MQRGQNVPLTADHTRLNAVLGWTAGEASCEVDLSALLLNATGKVRSDLDMVFYNQPVSPDGAVQYVGPDRPDGDRGETRVAVDLEAVSEEVAAVALTASVERGAFSDVPGLRLDLHDPAGHTVATFDLTDLASERALLVGELYRRAGGWRFRAVGQGWDSGLAGLAGDYGVAIDHGTDSEPDAAAAPPRTEPLAGESQTGESGLVSDVSGGEDREPPQRPLRTRRTPVRPKVRPLQLAGSDSWQPARLFSISGVGPAAEQEKRATSALLATMMAVRPFGRMVTARLGAPSGIVETYLEVPFPHGESSVSPDGVIRIARGGRVWTALVETKTGSSSLRADQVENYLDVARANDYDAVVTLSNDIAPAAGRHPVEVHKRKLQKVSLLHISWAEVLHDARMSLAHGPLTDPLQMWVIQELVRYLTHPRSGAATFQDMGPAWVSVRDAVIAGTLRASDRKAPQIAEGWARLVRQMTMELTADLGASVTQVLPRRLVSDHEARRQHDTERLAQDGTLNATLRIPDAAGPLHVSADVRTGHVRVGGTVQAPVEGSSQRRITWLLRQLKEAPDALLVEVMFSSRADSTCERLSDVRERPSALLHDRHDDVTGFQLTLVEPLGTKRSGGRGSFVTSVLAAVEHFYRDVLQSLRPWTPPAPKLAEGSLTEAIEDADR